MKKLTNPLKQTMERLHLKTDLTEGEKSCVHHKYFNRQ